MPYERNCVGVTAEYAAIGDAVVSVKNTCRDGQGTVRSVIEGQAELVGPGQFKVAFDSIPFAKADYWVLWTDATYQTAVVGTPSGRSGWILSRTAHVSDKKLKIAMKVLTDNGYDLGKLMDLRP